MLYVSTRNTVDSYTAYRALHEACAPDGGLYMPFHLPTYSAGELLEMKKQTSSEIVASVLNRFFGLRLSAWDVECTIGRAPFKLVEMGHRLTVAELWRNPEGNSAYLLSELYHLMTEGKSENRLPAGWPRIAIEIALLFGIYASASNFTKQGFDVAAKADDFATVTAILYAKGMGLPVNTVVCACSEDNGIWDLLNRGEFNTAGQRNLACLEYLLAQRLGTVEVQKYLSACDRKVTYRVCDEVVPDLNAGLFASVVSVDRIEPVAANMYRTDNYLMDAGSAQAFGGLQDYRSRTGVNSDTLILAMHRPN